MANHTRPRTCLSTPGDRLKRGFDLALGGVALTLSHPVQAAVAAAVRIKLGRPVLSGRHVPNLNGRPFTLLRFRMMLTPGQAGDPSGRARLSPFGAWLRSTSVDELPSLWNIVRGDMSLVGPRPLLKHYVPRYSPEQARRHEVRPGLTGLAQVSGRNATTWEDRLRLDCAYVQNRSLLLDLETLTRTRAELPPS